MSATNRGASRRPFDTYPTPAWCVRRLLERVPLPPGRWLEPCAGAGAVIRAVQAMRRDVAWSANELRAECASALRPLVGERLTIGSYFDLTGGRARADVIVTNPPYVLAESFVSKALGDAPAVAMLLRLGYLGSARRAPFLRAAPPDVYVLPNRPSFVDGRTDASEYAWFVWGPDRIRTHGTISVLRTTPPEERALSPVTDPSAERGPPSPRPE